MSIYVPYSRRELINEPRVVFLGRYRVEFKAFGLAEYMFSTPVVIVAGDFQKFSYYREFVVTLQHHRPVVIVSLPSLGSNDQRVANLSLDKMAEILKLFLVHFDFPRVSLISLSLGGWVASRFCCLYPDRVERLLLAGIARKPRESFRLTLEESVRILDDEHFADATILHLFHPRFWDTEAEPAVGVVAGASYRKLFRKQISQLSAVQKHCYRDNVQRLLKNHQTDSLPSVKTLVLAGEYDHFTLPFESADYAKACADGQFVLVKDADHLIQYEYLETVLDGTVRFLAGKSLEGVPGLVVGDAAVESYLDNKRTSPRRELKKPNAWLCSDAGEFRHSVSVRGINYCGGVLELLDSSIKLSGEDKDLELFFTGMRSQFKVVVFDVEAKGVKFLFKHVDIDEAKKFVHTLANPSYFVAKKKAKDSLRIAGYPKVIARGKKASPIE